MSGRLGETELRPMHKRKHKDNDNPEENWKKPRRKQSKYFTSSLKMPTPKPHKKRSNVSKKQVLRQENDSNPPPQKKRTGKTVQSSANSSMSKEKETSKKQENQTRKNPKANGSSDHDHAASNISTKDQSAGSHSPKQRKIKQHSSLRWESQIMG